MSTEQKFYRVERTSAPTSIMIVKDGYDPEAEARKSSDDVVSVEAITAEDVAAIRAARPLPQQSAMEAAKSQDANPLFAEAITYIENALRAMVNRQDVIEGQVVDVAREAGRVRFDLMRHGEAVDVMDDPAADPSAYPLLASTCPANVSLHDHAANILRGNLAWAENFSGVQTP
jgi:hypothetical protein